MEANASIGASTHALGVCNLRGPVIVRKLSKGCQHLCRIRPCVADIKPEKPVLAGKVIALSG
jgi:hypothetical protein